MAVIIGQGLMAQKFLHTNLGSDFLVLASGVSKSGETRVSEFNRERALIQQRISASSCATIIYFSTCSIYHANANMYSLHKQEMEQLIIDSGKIYHIYRLPQVVGVVNNTTLVSYLVKSLLTGSKVHIKKDATRNLIAVNDVLRLVELISNLNSKSCLQTNLACFNAVNVQNIYGHIAMLMNVAPNFELTEGGDTYDIPIQMLKDILSPQDVLFEADYWKRVLSEYVPQIIKLIKQNEKK